MPYFNSFITNMLSLNKKDKTDVIQEYVIDSINSVILPSGHNFKIIYPKRDVLKPVANFEYECKFTYSFAKCEVCDLILTVWLCYPPRHIPTTLKWGVIKRQSTIVVNPFISDYYYSEDTHGCNIRIMEQALL